MAETAAHGRTGDPRARRVGVAVVVTLALMVGLAVAKCGLNDASVTGHLDGAFVALDRALDGDAAGWEEAREAFRDAAKQSVFDTYPVFCLSVVDKLEPASLAEAAPPAEITDLDAIPAALVASPRASVREALVEISVASDPDERARATAYLRLLGDLEVAAAARRAAASR